MLLLRLSAMFVLLAISLFAQSTLAVVEKKAGKVGFYTVEGKRTGEVQIGAFPHEMVFSPGRRVLYVTDKGEGGNTITIIDVAARKKAGAIDLGSNRRPHGMAVLPTANSWSRLRILTASCEWIRWRER